VPVRHHLGRVRQLFLLFSYIDSRDSVNIPHDLRILKEVFKCDHGQYAHENFYWKSHNLLELINACEDETKRGFLARVDQLKAVYEEMSNIYQKSPLQQNLWVPSGSGRAPSA
jgi:hypothetical protein